MDEREIATARQKIALYREYLAKGVPGGMAAMYLVEIARLETILKQVQAAKAGPVR